MDSYLCVVACARPKGLRWFVTRNPDYIVSTDHVDKKTERLVFAQLYPTASAAYAGMDYFASLKPVQQWKVIRKANPELTPIEAPKPLVTAGGGEDSAPSSARLFKRVMRWLENPGGMGLSEYLALEIDDDEEPGTGGVRARLPFNPRPRQGSDAKQPPIYA